MTQMRDIRFVASTGPGVPGHFISRAAAPGHSSASPVLVMVHGISRNAAEHAFRAATAPQWTGHTVIAPLFDATTFGHYQSLSAGHDQHPADQGLIALLDQLSASGVIAHDRIELFGFSGGAQFAHRFAMKHPERIRFLSLAAAGWYTMPDAGAAYPEGLQNTDIHVQLPAFLELPIHVMVGSRDTSRDSTLRRGKQLDRTQGRTRLERARGWHKAVHQSAESLGVATQATLDVIPDVAHDFGQCVIEGRLLERVWQRRCDALAN